MFAYVEYTGAMAPPPTPNPESVTEIAKRLKLLREALGYSQGFIAQLASVTPAAWGNWEQGKRRIDLDPALRLCRNTGVTLPYIYQGSYAHLPQELLEKLQLELRDKQRSRPRRA